MFTNDTTKQVKVGNLTIGGGAEISIQSMLNAPWDDINGNVEQAKRLEATGCEIIRVSVPDMVTVPLVE